jgi:hypothetical protein
MGGGFIINLGFGGCSKDDDPDAEAHPLAQMSNMDATTTAVSARRSFDLYLFNLLNLVIIHKFLDKMTLMAN